MTAGAPRTQADRAAAARTARSSATDVGRRLAVGEVDLLAVLTALDSEHEDLRRAVAPLRVERLLRYVPGVGARTVLLICRRAGVDRGLKVGALAETARRRLADELQRFDRAAYRGRGPLKPLDTTTPRETR